MPDSAMANRMTFAQRVQVFVQSSPARMAVIISVLMFAATGLYSPSSFNINAVVSIAMLTILLSLASAGQTIVLIGGGIDFTVGAVMSTAAIMTTYLMRGQDGMILQVLFLALLMGAAVGLVSGVCAVKIGLPPMIVTMAISNVVTRLQYVFTQGNPSGTPGPFFVKTIITRIGGYVPTLVFYALAVYPLVFFLLNRSRFGRQVYLVGNNPVAAKLSGIKVNKVKIMTYIFSGMFAAFAGMLATGYNGVSRCQIFDDYAFNSLVAVIVGGTSFNGGVGSFTGSIAGALLMTVLSNTLTVFALSQPLRNIIQGVVLVILLVTYNRAKSVRQ